MKIPAYAENPLEAHNLGFREYIYAYYYSVTTMVSVGYGDISPVNQTEVIFCVLFMLITCGMFAFIINKIGQIIEGLSTERN